MDSRAETDFRKEEAGGPHAGVHQRAGDLQQPVRRRDASPLLKHQEDLIYVFSLSNLKHA